MFPIVKGLYQHSRFKGLLLRRTYPELEQELIIRSKLWYPHAGARYQEDKKRWTFPSGAIIQFGHCEYESDVRKYDSAEYQFVGWDELTSFTEFQYRYISFSRTRSSSGIPIMIRGATNPGNVGHVWVKGRFVDPAPSGIILIDNLTKNKRIFITAKATDNQHNDAGYVDRLMMLPEAERRAKLDGSWEAFEGQVFKEFRVARLQNEPPNALHVISPFEIPAWWPRILAIDWGYSALTYAIWGAISPDERLYVYREKSWRGCPIAQWATEVAKASDNEVLSDIILCQSAWQNRGNDETVAESFERYSGLSPRSSENDRGSRILGKLDLQEYLRWEPRPRRVDAREGFDNLEAQSILRKLGLEAYERYIHSFMPEPEETNLPKIQFFDHCKLAIRTLPLCIYETADSKTGKLSEDVREFKDDDPYDGTRYLVKAAKQYRLEHRGEGERLAALAKVSQELTQTGDQTSFYRKMEALDRKVVPIRPVSRFRRNYVA
jgi:hypothetical protein